MGIIVKVIRPDLGVKIITFDGAVQFGVYPKNENGSPRLVVEALGDYKSRHVNIDGDVIVLNDQGVLLLDRTLHELETGIPRAVAAAQATETVMQPLREAFGVKPEDRDPAFRYPGMSEEMRSVLHGGSIQGSEPQTFFNIPNRSGLTEQHHEVIRSVMTAITEAEFISKGPYWLHITEKPRHNGLLGTLHAAGVIYGLITTDGFKPIFKLGVGEFDYYELRTVQAGCQLISYSDCTAFSLSQENGTWSIMPMTRKN
jgi:hypothetical protein